MKTRSKILFCIFLLLGLADVLLLAFGNETAPRYVKPFLMPFLCATALSELLPENSGRMPLLLAIGLLFHTAGDIFLLFDSHGFVWFALGLGSFLVGHLFYLSILIPSLGKLSYKESMTAGLAPLAAVALIVPFFKLEWPLNAAVTVYGFVLLCVATCGVIGALRKMKYSGWIIAGGIFFIISDALIAVNLFLGIDFPLRHSIDMATYLFAECCLVGAMVSREKSAVE